jgi:biotin transport system substrate-specific component
MIGADKSLAAATITMLPFVPGDLIKAVLAGVVTEALWKARPDVVLSRA